MQKINFYDSADQTPFGRICLDINLIYFLIVCMAGWNQNYLQAGSRNVIFSFAPQTRPMRNIVFKIYESYYQKMPSCYYYWHYLYLPKIQQSKFVPIFFRRARKGPRIRIPGFAYLISVLFYAGFPIGILSYFLKICPLPRNKTKNAICLLLKNAFLCPFIRPRYQNFLRLASLGAKDT